jgi:hypothetical protein
MSKRTRLPIVLALTLVAGLGSAEAFDFNEQFLVAACSPDVPASGKIRSATVATSNGIGVRHRGQLVGDAVLYCQIDADESNYFNWLQVVAEDNTATGSVTATLYRQDILGPGAPQAMYSVTTTNQAGVQIASNAGIDDELNEYQYVYWIEVRLNRSSSASTVTVYSVALMDVF